MVDSRYQMFSYLPFSNGQYTCEFIQINDADNNTIHLTHARQIK
jgi:hypothetical protein